MCSLLKHKIEECIVHLCDLDYLVKYDEAEAAAAERRSHLQMCDYNMRVQSTLLITDSLKPTTISLTPVHLVYIALSLNSQAEGYSVIIVHPVESISTPVSRT